MNSKYKIVVFVVTILFLTILSINYAGESDYTKKLSGIYNKSFEKYVVFYPQHQDDEVLWGGSAILEAIRQNGKDNVYVVLVSDGSGVNVFKNKKYKNLSRKEKEKLRNYEFKAALKDLGVKEENTIILSEVDNKVGTHFDTMEKVALEFENKFKNVTHVAHSYKYDDHSMHIKNGNVIHTLYKKGKIKHTLYFLKPSYLYNVDDSNKIIYLSKDNKSRNVLKNACLEYKIIDESKNRYGIGYISAHSHFDYLLNDKNLTSVLHLPI